jgi:hypothetical protein
MQNLNKHGIQLLEQGFITEEQLIEIKSYRSRTIFRYIMSWNCFSTLFCPLQPESEFDLSKYWHDWSRSYFNNFINIDLVCYYFSFKNSSGFRREETKPNLRLPHSAILLTCIFIGYLQFQYTTFGTHYGLATLIPTGIGSFVLIILIIKVSYLSLLLVLRLISVWQ